MIPSSQDAEKRFCTKEQKPSWFQDFSAVQNANWTNMPVNLKDEGPDPKFHARPCPLTLRGGNRKSSSYRQHVLLQRYS